MPTLTANIVRRLLSKNENKTLFDSSLIPAAVMLLLYPKNSGFHILFTKRSDLVEKHKNEISLPGGQRENRDSTMLDTALRETQEEIGIRPQDVEVLGQLEDVSTKTAFLVKTFVGTIPSPYKFTPNKHEVAKILEIPICALTNKYGIRHEAHIVNKTLVAHHSYGYKGHLIFGATAQILTRFLQIIQ